MNHGFPIETEDGFRVYDDVPGEVVLSYDGMWLNGVYPTVEAALEAGRAEVASWDEE